MRFAIFAVHKTCAYALMHLYSINYVVLYTFIKRIINYFYVFRALLSYTRLVLLLV